MNNFFSGIARVWSALWNNRLLWLLYSVTLLLTLAAGWLWLYISDEHAWQLLVTFLLGFAVVFAFLWINATALRAFTLYHRGLLPPVIGDAVTPLRTVLLLLPWLALVIFVARLFDWHEATILGFSGWMHTSLPASLELRISPSTVTSLVEMKLWFLYWIFTPWLLLPVAAMIADDEGPRGLRRWWRIARNPQFIATLIICVLAGYYLPRWISYWAPEMKSMKMEFVSMALRLPVAYTMAGTMWLAILSALGFATARSNRP